MPLFPLNLFSRSRRNARRRNQRLFSQRLGLAAERLEGRHLMATFTASFGDLELAAESHVNGPIPNGTTTNGVTTGTFESGRVTFTNSFDNQWGSWAGFGYSNRTDNTTAGFGNQFSGYAGSGRDDSNYGIASGYADAAFFDPMDPTDLATLPQLALPTGATIKDAYFTNMTYPALSMRDGDTFAKKFGGDSGNDPDWFKLSVFGTDAAGNPLTTTVELYLADFRFSDNSQDYILNTWTNLDLSSLAGASKLYFNVSSSDVGEFGMNTPALFAVDDISYEMPNTAPVLDTSVLPVMPAIDEDVVIPASVSIGDLLAGAVTDPDGPHQGIAITELDTTNGRWQYSLEGLYWFNIPTTIPVSAQHAFLLPADGLARIRFKPNGHYFGQAEFQYRAWDQSDGLAAATFVDASIGGGTSAFSAAEQTATQTISPVNDAPVLINQNPRFPTINEDTAEPAGALVRSLVNLSDIDGSGRGIAITHVSHRTRGVWQYSLNGTSWINIPAVSSEQALLLPADAIARIRFKPNPNFHGEVAMRFRAWDRSDNGVAGSLANISIVGGSTPFSFYAGSATQVVRPVNDAPALAGIGSLVNYRRDEPAKLIAPLAQVKDIDSDVFTNGRLRVRIGEGAHGGNRLAIGGNFIVVGDEVRLGTSVIGIRESDGVGLHNLAIRFTSSATRAIVEQLVRSITFRAGGPAGTRKVYFQVSDGGAAGLSAEVSKTINVR